MVGYIKIKDFFDLRETDFSGIFDNVENPYEILPLINDYILKTGPQLNEDYKEIKENVWVGKGTTIAESALINGPVIIGKNCEIRHCAFIRGRAVIGNSSVIGNSTEVKNSFLFNCVQAPHFNYVGDAIMGFKSHIGAGVILSNVRSIPGSVNIRVDDKLINTGLKKFSTILGDHVEVGCNSVLNPGTIVGKESVIYPLSSVRGFIPEKHILKNNGIKFPKRS